MRVDAIAAHPGAHIGPVRMRRLDCPAMERAEALRQANEMAARDPEQVLAALTRNNASFTERDLDRYLAKHLGGAVEPPDIVEIATAKAAVLGHRQLLALHDRETGEVAGRYSTRAVREQERAALADGMAVAEARHHQGVKAGYQAAALASRSLRQDQRAAFEHAVSPGGLKLIEGRAGTGKSYTLAAVREAHELAGYRVVGLAPTNAVAQDLKTDGFSEAGTVHSALFQIKNGRMAFDRRTVLVVDEAAMLDSRVTGELLAEAKRAGAKVVLTGDDRQLASIERGGMFAELRQAHGAAEITEVTRQNVAWQRQAARDLAEGRFDTAVAAFDVHGAIAWTANSEAARAALVACWTADTLADPHASRFVFAYTNADVSQLNAELRQVRRDGGELASPDVRLETKHGEADFAVGDRVQFTDTDKRLQIYNGNAGVITGIDATTGHVMARLDAAAGVSGREVTWSAADFMGFRHGYAGTIYKGQGKTLDHTYLLHTHHWRAAASYVALTRQRESAQVFVSTETAADARQLARQMGRGEVRAASVAWATTEELAPELRRKLEATTAVESKATTVSPPAPTREHEKQEVMWMIPPHVSRDGRDSLGRGTSAAEIETAVTADEAVRREVEALRSYLQGAYRNPCKAGAALDVLVKGQGWTSAAARIAAIPSELGELRGSSGFLASAKARAKRAAAQRAAGAIGPNLMRAAAAEARAAQAYCASVEAQRIADATGIPRLTDATLEAISVMAAAQDVHARGKAWQAAQADKTVAGELRAFGEAVQHRFGTSAMRAVLDVDHWKGVSAEPSIPSAATGQHVQLNQVAGLMRTLKAAERATVVLQSEEGQRQSTGF